MEVRHANALATTVNIFHATNMGVTNQRTLQDPPVYQLSLQEPPVHQLQLPSTAQLQHYQYRFSLPVNLAYLTSDVGLPRYHDMYNNPVYLINALRRYRLCRFTMHHQ